MNRRDFTGYIHHPQMLEQGVKKDFHDLAERYPYCSSIQVLYTLLLYAVNDHEFNLQLKKSVAYATSRKKLKELLETFPIAKAPEFGSSDDRQLTSDDRRLTTDDQRLTIDEPWLTTSEERETKGHPKEILSKEAIIQKFIREEPRISAPRATFFTPSESAIRSNADDAGIVSETLARLYSEQGNIAKAIQVYEKLSLLFPEKSSYFAAQIRKLG